MSTLMKDLEARGITLEARLGFKSAAPLDADTAALLQARKADLLLELVGLNAVPRLPWQLEALLRAASSGVLPEGTQTLPSGLVTDLNRYALAWGCSYLMGDREHALTRLWEAHRVWQGVN